MSIPGYIVWDEAGVRYLSWGQGVLSTLLWQLMVPIGEVVPKFCIWILPLQIRASAAEFLLKSPQLMKVVVPV